MLNCVQCVKSQSERQIIKFHFAETGICAECLDVLVLGYTREHIGWGNRLIEGIQAVTSSQT